jgi:hypothetical protein
MRVWEKIIGGILIICKKGDEMIHRWDNAPHWGGIRTFPFHLHLPDTNKPVECGEVFVNDVLSEIRDIFSGK